MGQVTNLILLEKGLRADFMKAYMSGESSNDLDNIIMKTSSSSNQERYAWLGNVPRMTLWSDERQLKGLSDYNYIIPNYSYEATLKVNKDSLDDDQLGAIKIRIADLAKKARNFPRKLAFDAIVAGESALCYDGQFFFDTDHPVGSITASNDLTATYAGTLPTVSELATALNAAIAAMKKFVDDSGELINDGELALKMLVSSDIEATARELLNATQISGTTNTLKGIATLVSSGRLSGAPFYLFNTEGAVKPLIHQVRQPVKFESQTNGESAFMRKDLLYGVDSRDGFGYGLWQKAILTKKA